MMTEPAEINIDTGLSSAIQVYTGVPKYLIRHSISDEELTMLCEKTKDFVDEIMWAAIGAVVGSAPNVIASWMTVVPGAASEGRAHNYVFVAALAVAIVTGWIRFNRGRRSTSLEEQIRNRTNEQHGQA
ncbi:hypothetical protein [Candidatus Phyllobacterium onerii]|uniref:hypothetical protein n=1 Tax=Candidatus Phyllobacterium onerii TaxID=3020828 RepID=UPI00232E1D0C|nr:hypothetical protein [Phyllobacterium sp. IY22]